MAEITLENATIEKAENNIDFVVKAKLGEQVYSAPFPHSVIASAPLLTYLEPKPVAEPPAEEETISP